MANIHPTAIVHKNAELACDVVVGPYAIIGEHVKIGENTEIMAHAVVDGRTTIGKNNKIYPSACVGLPPQDLKYKGEPTKLVIGDNNQIREFTTLHLSATIEEDTVIGSNNLLMAYTHVAHNCQIGNNIVIANAVQLAGHVQIQDHVTIGGLSAGNQFVRVGVHAFIGGCSGFNKDVPPYTRGQGSRAYIIAGINTTGLSRRGFTDAQIEAITQVFKIFYHSKRNVTQAIEHAESLPDLTTEQKIFIDFCKNSKRGIYK